MRVPNENLYVPIAFTDADGVTHRADSWNDLIANVRDYRYRNNKPVGSPQAEIFEQVCFKYPRRCMPSKGGQRKASQGHLSARLITWLSKLLRTSIRFVSPQEAERRANICLGCVEQSAWRRSGCSTCRAIDKLATRAADGRRLNDLSACDALGEDCRVSVLIDQPGVGAGLVPAHCWRKNS